MENLLLDGQFSSPYLKISDFAYSKNAVLDSQPKTNVGSPSYTPPELLLAQRGEGAAYDGAAIDVWSSGVILFYMLTAQLPFQVPPGWLQNLQPAGDLHAHGSCSAARCQKRPVHVACWSGAHQLQPSCNDDTVELACHLFCLSAARCRTPQCQMPCRAR